MGYFWGNLGINLKIEIEKKESGCRVPDTGYQIIDAGCRKDGRGNWVTGRRGDLEKVRWGDLESGREGDEGTCRKGNYSNQFSGLLIIFTRLPRIWL